MVVATVVILTTKYPEHVIKCLERQTFKSFEVIYAKEHGIVNAMNNALSRAQGEIFIRIDDDVDIPPTWLEELLKPFQDWSVAGVTGPTYVPCLRRKNRDSIVIWEHPNRFLTWLVDNNPHIPAKIYRCGSVSYGSNYLEKIDRKKRYKIDHLEGTNWAMRTDLIRYVGGFDPKFDGVAEWFDTDVEQKIKKLGFKLEYNVNAYLWHMLDKTEHYNDRFDGIGRMKNWLRFHLRHSKFHYKKVIFLIVWALYFLKRRFK